MIWRPLKTLSMQRILGTSDEMRRYMTMAQGKEHGEIRMLRCPLGRER